MADKSKDASVSKDASGSSTAAAAAPGSDAPPTQVNASAQKEDPYQAKRKKAGPWLHSWYDPVAGLHAFSNCIRLADLWGDGEDRLLIADADKKLKVFKGDNRVHEFLFCCTVQSMWYMRWTTHYSAVHSVHQKRLSVLSLNLSCH